MFPKRGLLGIDHRAVLCRRKFREWANWLGRAQKETAEPTRLINSSPAPSVSPGTVIADLPRGVLALRRRIGNVIRPERGFVASPGGRFRSRSDRRPSG